jgi:hypothetical protein
MQGGAGPTDVGIARCRSVSADNSRLYNMAEPKFRLPVGGFEQIGRILRSYLRAAKGQPGVAVGLDDVARRAAMNRTAVSGNNAFLASLGVIEGGNNKQLTPLGVTAALTLEHPNTPDAHQAWMAVIESSPDLERIVDAVRIRKGMNEDALLSHIVLTAGVPKTARTLTGARTIVDLLEFAGVLHESDGTFTIAPADGLETLTTTGLATPTVLEPPLASVGPLNVSAGVGRVALNIHLWVNAKDTDLEDLADELKQFLGRLADT